MRKFIATAAVLVQGFVPSLIVDKYTQKNLDGTFRNPFRVMGVSYPYDASSCVTASRDQRRASRACRGHWAQSQFYATFRG